jgi:glycosyltransferase 2 family protein
VSRVFRTFLGAALSLIAIVGCVWWALEQDAPKFPNSAAGYMLLVGALLVSAFLNTLRGWRWHHILRGGEVPHQTRDAYGLTVVGYMGNTVLPARGGEVLRVLLLSERSGARHRQVLGSIVPERMLDAAALLLLFAAATVAGIGDSPVGSLPAILGIVAFVVVLAALVVYLRLRIAGRLHRFADRVRPFTRSTRQLLTTRGVALLALSLTLWLLEAVVLSLVMSSLDLSASIPEAMFVVVLVAFFALIPAAPGYVGTFDAAAIFGLDALGIAGGAALGCVLLYRFIIFVPMTVLGLILMVTHYGGLRGVRRRSQAQDDAGSTEVEPADGIHEPPAARQTEHSAVCSVDGPVAR